MKEIWYELYIGETLVQKFKDKDELVKAYTELKGEGHTTLTLRYCSREEITWGL